MREAIIYLLAIVGACVVAMVIAYIACDIKVKFQRWRTEGCKIKCLCKHKYKFDWIYGFNQSDLGLECCKCGKKKRLWIDYDSFKDM